MSSRTTIIHHANCPDGFGSAWLLRQALPDDTAIHAASYGEDVPFDLVDDADVYLVDFCYPGPELTDVAARARSLVVLDHHQTAVGYVAEAGLETYDSVDQFVDSTSMPGPVIAILDMNHSGVGIVQQYTGLEEPFLAFVEDRDLWRFSLLDTPDVFAAVTSRPYTLEAWDEIASMSIDSLVIEGQAINRYRDKMIADTVSTAWLERLPTGDVVWCAASPYAIGSDVAGELAKRDPENFAAYFVHYGTRIRFGLRSSPDGADVAAIAETVGGGGHRHAAGFEIDADEWWPGAVHALLGVGCGDRVGER
jgi:uncharacterized protein